MPRRIVPGSKTGVPQDKSRSFEIATQQDCNVGLGNADIPVDRPRKHHMAPAENKIASPDQYGWPSVTEMLDEIVAIVSARNDGTARVSTGQTKPCLQVFRIGKRMKESTGIGPNAHLQTNRKSAGGQFLAKWLAPRAVSSGMGECGESDLRLHAQLQCI